MEFIATDPAGFHLDCPLATHLAGVPQSLHYTRAAGVLAPPSSQMEARPISVLSVAGMKSAWYPA